MSTRTDVGISFVMSSVSQERQRREAERAGRAFAIPLQNPALPVPDTRGEMAFSLPILLHLLGCVR